MSTDATGPPPFVIGAEMKKSTTMGKKTMGTVRPAAEVDDGYPALEQLIAKRVAESTTPLFMTDAENLYDTFLANLPHDRRQHYDCNLCRKFVDSYGGLVTINDAGIRSPVVFFGLSNGPRERLVVPDMFRSAVAAVYLAVFKAKVVKPFCSSQVTWGTPVNEPGPGSKYQGQRWTHLSGQNPNIYKATVKTADQQMAEWQEDYRILCSAFEEYSQEIVREAIRVLDADALSRGEKAVGVAKWYLDLLESKSKVKNNVQRANLVWRAVATAPPGWCHIKNTVVATLFDDIKAGMGFEAVSKRWNEKMHPLQYQRPTTLKAGNLESSEKLIEKLGAAKSLERRFARLDEVVAKWRPATETAPVGQPSGVFGHLKPTGASAPSPVTQMRLPPKTLTWVRFSNEVLPTAAKLEILIPSNGPFYGLVTAADPEAPPIVQWDGANGIRNPVSWYFHQPSNFAHHWSLTGGTWEPVAAVFAKPPHWFDVAGFKHFDEGVMFAIQKAKDIRGGTVKRGGGLFPEILKTEFREAKAAIEAYSNNAVLAGADEGNANGLCYDKGNYWGTGCRLRVIDGQGAVSEYTLDRWE